MCYGMGCEFEKSNGECLYHGNMCHCPHEDEYDPWDDESNPDTDRALAEYRQRREDERAEWI